MTERRAIPPVKLTRREAGFFFPADFTVVMNNTNPERFPVITIFCLIFLGWETGLGAVYLWAVGEPPLPAISLCLARLFAAAGLPDSSVVPIVVNGRGYTVGQWLRAAATPAGAATLRASEWLLFYLPTVSFFLTGLSILIRRRWRIKRRPTVVRGVRVIKR